MLDEMENVAQATQSVNSTAASLLAAVPMAPKDPILGVSETFAADQNPKKVNLGVGVYYDDTGKIPLLECVRQAERQLAESAPSRGYLPIDGLQVYDKAVQALVFGDDSPALVEGRLVTVQALGGTGALKVGADFLRRVVSSAHVWVSEPSWENHRALFEVAGFTVHEYPYYDSKTHGLSFPAMIDSLKKAPIGSIVVLHACCHNPTGIDLSPDQWREVLDVVRTRSFVPFLDLAYQGLGEGLEADARTVDLFARSLSPVFVSSSFSKSFSLYGERIGALSVVTADADETARVLSQLKRLVRANYSTPPTHGGQLVATVLTTAELRAMWEKELGEIRERIKSVRNALVEKIHRANKAIDFSFVLRQRGMFSYSGLSRDQVARLRQEYSIYAIDTGRICVAALNSKNIDYVADAISSVLR